MPILKTIGVYGFDRESFLEALSSAKVDLLLDVRQRRGVRGSEYAWANAQRLLCVERDPEACHRSLIAERLQHTWGVEVEHLRP